MSKFASSLLLLLLSYAAASAGPAANASAFVNLLGAQKYQNAFGQFDERMKEGLPAVKLQAAWQHVTDKLGAFQNSGETKTATAQGYTVVYVRANFAHGSLWAQLVYDKDNEVAGLHFLPVTPTAP